MPTLANIYSETPSDQIQNHHLDASEIQKYFKGKTVFLTGATGFLGKLVIEKLLRTCGDLEKIYMLVREKRGKEPNERFKELFDNPAFEPLKKQTPNFSDKLKLCIGDCLKPDLGLTQKDLDVLKNEVDCVLHCAATVRFDASLRKATYINVRAVRDLLKIAKEMKQLSSFIHVSTAFSFCSRKNIYEEIYELPITGQQLMDLVEALNDDMLDAVTPVVLNEWPNTYAFTKAVAEEVVKTEGKGLPVSIFRPAIVIASLKEPVPGWLDNVYGPTGVLIAAGLGLMRTLYCDKSKRADLVPADYVVNAILATAWNVGQRYEFDRVKSSPEPCRSESIVINDKQMPMVYNYVSGCQNPLNWASYMNLAVKHASKIPSPLIIWHYVLFLNSNVYMHLLCEFLFHTVPAYIVDSFLSCIGRKPVLVNGYRKIRKFSNVISYFCTRQWNFKNANVQNLWNKLNARDKELFEFDIKTVNWDTYFQSYMLGTRLYLLKDPLDTVPQGKRKVLFFKFAHYTVLAILLFFIYVLLRFLFRIFSIKV